MGQGDGSPKFIFDFFVTANGGEVVREEIRKILPAGPPRKEFGELLSRIQHDRQLPGDTDHLGDGLWEARLSYQRNAYRLYYAAGSTGAVLLGLKFHQKGGQGAQARAIKVARARLADWRDRI
jgi:phage-related protein